MLGVIVMVGIIGAVFLTSVQGKDPAANCKNKLATPWHDTVRRTVTFDELS
ncbi:hypothetical protein [Lacticaseibacillus manihotivorans]|uniref:hypothetical protein n=1 Tax=Lacticaseibacillus manihotivorans TaxID=88233 RepID=UPI00178086C7|nr:hypothetical protein [Lacticaseibacillus manihotivorans]